MIAINYPPSNFQRLIGTESLPRTLMPKSKPVKIKKPAAKKAKPPKAVAKTRTASKPAKSMKSAKPSKAAKAPKPKAVKAPKPAKAGNLNGSKKAVKTESRMTASNIRPGAVINLQRPPASKVKLTPFLEKQKERLVHLRDSMMDSMMGVAKDTLRSRAEGSEASAFGMHQADAGSDAYDRDFALSLLSQEQDALYEIEEALKRIELGTYGTCEMTNKPIAHARLEAIPFARYTVECQSQLEKQNKHFNIRKPVTSLFGLTDEEPGEAEEEEPAADNKE